MSIRISTKNCKSQMQWTKEINGGNIVENCAVCRGTCTAENVYPFIWLFVGSWHNVCMQWEGLDVDDPHIFMWIYC